MDFTVTEEQAELAGLTRKILAERDAPWGDLAAAGVLAAGLPAALGGAGLGLLEQCSVLIELGRSASSVPCLASVVLGAGAVAEFGPAGPREQWAGRGAGVPGGAVGRRGAGGTAAADGLRLGGPGGAVRGHPGGRPGARWYRGRGLAGGAGHGGAVRGAVRCDRAGAGTDRGVREE